MTPQLRGHLAMLSFSALVAGSFSLGARSANLIAPEALTVLRFMLASVILGALLFWRQGGQAFALQKGAWRWAFLGGLMAGYFVLMFYGLQTAAPVTTAAVFTLTPLITAGFGWLIARQKLTSRMGLALAIGALGAVWVIFRGDLAALMRLEIGQGELIYLAGCILHALYAVLVRRLNRGESALASSWATMTAGGAVLLIWAAPDLIATDWANIAPIVWITLAYISIAATAISTLTLQYAAMRLPASKVMAYTYLVPSWVMVLEILFAGAIAPISVLAGIGLTCLALWLLLKE